MERTNPVFDKAAGASHAYEYLILFIYSSFDIFFYKNSPLYGIRGALIPFLYSTVSGHKFR